MSHDNVEIVQAVFAEFERGNFWVPEFFDSDVRIVWLDVAGGEPESLGLEAMGRMAKEWVQAWEQITLVPERFIEAGDQVVVIAEWRGRGKTSGVFTKLRHGAVYSVRDGKVASIISYADPADALDAAGVRE